jgi:hypothetical protein
VAGGMGAEIMGLAQAAKQLKFEVDRLSRVANEMEYAAHVATVEGYRLMKEYAESIAPGAFEVKVQPLAEILEGGFNDREQHEWIMIAAWSRWMTLWGERPPPEKPQLY